MLFYYLLQLQYLLRFIIIIIIISFSFKLVLQLYLISVRFQGDIFHFHLSFIYLSNISILFQIFFLAN